MDTRNDWRFWGGVKISNPKLRQKCEAQRKESEKRFKNFITLDTAFMVILHNSYSIKNKEGSSFSPDEAMIIKRAKKIVEGHPYLYEFLNLWEKNQLNVVIQ